MHHTNPVGLPCLPKVFVIDLNIGIIMVPYRIADLSNKEILFAIRVGIINNGVAVGGYHPSSSNCDTNVNIFF